MKSLKKDLLPEVDLLPTSYFEQASGILIGILNFDSLMG